MISILSVLAFAKYLFLPSVIEVHGFPSYKLNDLVSSSTMDQFAQVEQLQNWDKIKRLIQCESSWINQQHMDSNNKMSRGILQFQDQTWDSFSSLSGIQGKSTDPYTAILLADFAISNGLGHHWACWHWTGLDKEEFLLNQGGDN